MYIGKEELDKAQARATSSFLKVMDYNPNFPRTAPREIGGMGLNRLYTDKGINNIFQMLKHIGA